MKKQNKKVLLIIPAYNEEENILKTCNNIKKENKELDFIVINDGSKDKTLEILKKNDLPHINLIHNLGIGGAVQTGYKYALEHDYDIAIQFDGDGQHDVRYVKKLIKPILDGEADFTIGSRFVEELSKFKSSKARRIGINIISFFIKLFTGKKIYDTTSGFRAVNKDIIKFFAMYYPIEYPEPVSTTELLKQGKRVKEVSVEMNEREGGVSSIRAWKNAYYMINVILSIVIVSIRRYK
ncbi:MAG: glycosyltransferase family 2 protein [Bacilli bacterium]|nr:glycosyltransferase family 2 protein [Bacilli bacterium]